MIKLKICVLGLDFAELEARMMANAAKHGIDVEVLSVDELQGNHVDFVHSGEHVVFAPRRHGKSTFAKLYGRWPTEVEQTEPHWVTRNKKGARY